ncbi:hypothetical protein BJ508DRAFT_364979 [Ascobolus immersus RN42]|uniref:Uncharacterized protein n=1 Tax=Ascobolus immersus RN42 TaxID=1160509 RepID=A0A3N4HRT2_ASCIM|nr:hypothetical protein BJ508DRAFT_364979 [Ascobolus immersus RN42]
MPFYQRGTLDPLCERAKFVQESLLLGPQEELIEALNLLLPLMELPLDHLSTANSYIARLINGSKRYDHLYDRITGLSMNHPLMIRTVKLVNKILAASVEFERLLEDIQKDEVRLSILRVGMHQRQEAFGVSSVKMHFKEWWTDSVFLHEQSKENRIVRRWLYRETHLDWFWYLDVVEEIRFLAQDLCELWEELVEFKMGIDAGAVVSRPESDPIMADSLDDHQQLRSRRV